MVTKKATLPKKKNTKKPTTKRASFRLVRKAERPPVAKIASTRELMKQTLKIIKQNWKVLFGLGLLYVLSHRVLAEGVARLNLEEIKGLTDGSVIDAVSDIAALTSTATNWTGGDAGEQSAYSTFLTLIFGLTIVWALRQVMAGNKVRIRDALYNACAPLVSTVILLFFVLLQLLPMAIGVFLYSVARSLGIISGGIEDMLFFFVAAAAALLTCYWLSASLIGLMAVTAPGMYPMVAWRTARQLVAYRRWPVFMRILIFALIMTVVWFLVVVIVATLSLLANVGNEILMGMRGVTLIVVVTYLYQLYRSLIDGTDEQDASS